VTASGNPGTPPGWRGAVRPEKRVTARSKLPQKKCTGLALPKKPVRNLWTNLADNGVIRQSWPMLGGRYFCRNQTSRGMSRPLGIMRSPRPSTFRPRRSQTIMGNSASRLSLRCWWRRAGPTASVGCHYRSAEAGPALTLLRLSIRGSCDEIGHPFLATTV
jgi:hypothetical protein